MSEEKRSSDKRRYRDLRANGLCVDCRGPSPAAARCSVCSAEVKRRLDEKMAIGLCGGCGQSTDRPGKVCTSCKERGNKNNREIRAKRKEQGLCSLCRKPTERQGKVCLECRGKTTRLSAKIRSDHIASGMCTMCGECRPIKSGGRCFECNLKSRFSHTKKHAVKTREMNWSLTSLQYLEIICEIGDDFVKEKPCYYCDYPVTLLTTCGGLERIDNAQGYIATNVVLCCEPCNDARSDNFESDVFKQFIAPGIALAKEATGETKELRSWPITENLKFYLNKQKSRPTKVVETSVL